MLLSSLLAKALMIKHRLGGELAPACRVRVLAPVAAPAGVFEQGEHTAIRRVAHNTNIVVPSRHTTRTHGEAKQSYADPHGSN